MRLGALRFWNLGGAGSGYLDSDREACSFWVLGKGQSVRLRFSAELEHHGKQKRGPPQGVKLQQENVSQTTPVFLFEIGVGINAVKTILRLSNQYSLAQV